jgi:glucose-6-phosphate isomerase
LFIFGKKSDMISLSLDIQHVLPFLEQDEVKTMQHSIEEQHRKLMSGTGKGGDFLGWRDIASGTDPALITRIISDAMEIRKMTEVVVIIGIGGSYLGTRAIVEAMGHPFHALLPSRGNPLILYAGENISEDYHAGLMEILDRYSCAAIVISKSGTTTEPAIAFRLIREHLERKYGREGARQRIFAVTDRSKGALKKLADNEGYSTYIIPDDVGGRFSVLTSVGLLPLSAAGVDIRALLRGAGNMERITAASADLNLNPAALYAAIRNLLYRKGKTTEIMVTWLPQLVYLTEWWKQLFGESEGKDGKGIFPAGVTFSTDLHSMGQYIQEGPRHLFETVITVDNPAGKLIIPTDPDNTDGLNYLAGKRFSEVNEKAILGTIMAHVEGGVPNLRIRIPEVNAESLGQLIYFFEFSCALSGYVLDVNPFDQPGVEAYKKNMFTLLGKP